MAQAPLPNGAGGYQLGDGNVGEAQLSVQGAPTLLSADVTLTAAQLSNGLFTVDPAADITATLPTVALVEEDVNSAKVNSSFDIAVVNIDAGFQVTFATGTGWSIVGSAIVLEATSAQFRARKTGATTWTLYRIA
jgi:hypothetical protein